MVNQPYYGDISPVSAGIAGTCPRCGRGKLFAGFLIVARQCNSCDLSFSFADAGDGAAWFVMLVAGSVAVGLVLWVELTWQPSYWVHALIAIPAAVILPIALLRPVKGILLCQQYKTRAAPGKASDT
ncbi:MAG: DUF983 domain-containing protein [Rhizobiales bacterium]|nr:DUF983 domain-containing protein [Hyphomicrobiales bacterium]